MTTYYVGLGGNDGNSGLTWALRKLTLNGAEDVPVVAGDTVYIGPGVYRETLTVDVSGGAGTEIVYIGDVTGEHTDSVGGVVRITGSDNDTTATRTNCIVAVGKTYRVFRGFRLDMPTAGAISATSDPTNWTIEDCSFAGNFASNVTLFSGDNQSDNMVRRCAFVGRVSSTNYGIVSFYATGAGTQDAASVVENCLLMCKDSRGVNSNAIGGIAVRNCTCSTNENCFRVGTALPVGYTACTVYNCLIFHQSTAVRSGVLGEIVEDYNAFYGNSTDRLNVNVGGNSNAYSPLMSMPILHSGASQISGYRLPWSFGELSKWSALKAIAGASERPVDLLGIERPVTAAKNSWGAFQYQSQVRDTGTVHGGSASLELSDAGRVQFRVPVTNVSTTISVYVYREANYAGGNPQMIIKQPGQADDVSTDAAAASQWNLLTTTLTPAALPGWVTVELVSENTAAAGNYAVYFDDLAVS